jgi:hypothetical protein
MKLRDRLQDWLREQPLVVRDKIEVRVQPINDSMGLNVNLLLNGEQTVEKDFRKEISAEILRLSAMQEVILASPDADLLRAA